MHENPSDFKKLELNKPWRVIIPPDIVRHLATITESESQEDFKKVFRFILAIGERVIEKVWTNNDGQLIYRIGGKEEIIYDGYTHTFGDPQDSESEEE